MFIIQNIISSSCHGQVSEATFPEILLSSLRNVNDYVADIYRKQADLDRNKGRKGDRKLCNAAN